MIQVALLHVCQASNCKKVSSAVSNQGLQLATFILPKKLSSIKINCFSSKHFREIAVIFWRYFTKSFNVHYFVNSIIDTLFAYGKSLLAHLGIQCPKSKLRMTNKLIILISHQMKMIIRQLHQFFSGIVEQYSSYEKESRESHASNMQSFIFLIHWHQFH